VKRAWQAGGWRGGKIISIPLPITEMTEYHTKTEQMPYYSDLARDAGLLFDPELFRAYRKDDGFYVEFIFGGFETTEWVKRDE